MPTPKINITIPTFNREYCIAKAIESALEQTYTNFNLTVIDDGSKDHTWEVLQNYTSESNFAAIRLHKNQGSAQAKNISIMLSNYDAITFHSSDDIPSEHKVLIQARVMSSSDYYADDMLDWTVMEHVPGISPNIDIVLGAYKLIKMDGSVFIINNRISLVDDFFPNLQFPIKTSGDRSFINAGLFKKRVFEKLGGYLNSFEEGREFRNRTISAGMIYYFIEEPLLTKIESHYSSSTKEQKHLDHNQNSTNREKVRRKSQMQHPGYYRKNAEEKAAVIINLDQIEIEDTINSHLFTFNPNIPCTNKTKEKFNFLFPAETTSGPVLAFKKPSVS